MAEQHQLLDANGFDSWSEDYDQDVVVSDRENTYPFAAYRAILNFVEQRALDIDGRELLDVGFGTATLTKRLYDAGFNVTGLDFSGEMIRIAKAKMPQAYLVKHDLTEGFPLELEDKRFDIIVLTYSIHHLDKTAQEALLSQMLDHLTDGGKILIGDVMTETACEMQTAQVKDADLWDEEESYIVVEDLDPDDAVMEFTPMSYCSGVLEIYRRKTDSAEK